ncbi:MAG: type II toxin-antitoxin system VapC family toxin [Thermoanaerobaculia bacterium]
MTPASRLLLDTHIFLWWRGEPSRLTAEVQSSIATADLVFVSAASAWEARIKASLGRLDLPDTVEAGVLASGFERLLITFSHAERAASLPPHHRDPFDRMLVAQAQAEGLTLVTHDRLLEPYEVEILWA